jgi:hypothetical protein
MNSGCDIVCALATCQQLSWLRGLLSLEIFEPMLLLLQAAQIQRSAASPAAWMPQHSCEVLPLL